MAADLHGLHELADCVKPKQDYKQIFENATFHFYGAFESFEEFFIKDIIEALLKITKQNNFTFFKTGIRISNALKIKDNKSKNLNKNKLISNGRLEETELDSSGDDN